jgi:hypothetical protein
MIDFKIIFKKISLIPYETLNCTVLPVEIKDFCISKYKNMSSYYTYLYIRQKTYSFITSFSVCRYFLKKQKYVF